MEERGREGAAGKNTADRPRIRSYGEISPIQTVGRSAPFPPEERDFASLSLSLCRKTFSFTKRRKRSTRLAAWLAAISFLPLFLFFLPPSFCLSHLLKLRTREGREFVTRSEEEEAAAALKSRLSARVSIKLEERVRERARTLDFCAIGRERKEEGELFPPSDCCPFSFPCIFSTYLSSKDPPRRSRMGLNCLLRRREGS